MEKLLFIQAVLQLLVEYGLPGTIKIIKAWQVENPTIEDIKALPDLKDPEEYFEEGG